MKIAILTLPILTNYGGILQAYALQSALKSMGHDAWLLNRRRNPISNRDFFKNYLKKIIKKVLLKRDTIVLKETKIAEIEKIISQNSQTFIDKYIQPQTEKYYSSKQLEEAIKYNFDAYIVGSDQVWRPEYSYINDYFFEFLSNNNTVKKIAYAASFGVNNWIIPDTQKCRKLAQKFSAISVRENSGVKLCEEYLKVGATHVLDPTMLLSKDDYIANLHLNEIECSKGDLLHYFLDMNDEKQDLLDSVSKKLALTPFAVNSQTEDHYASIDKRVAPPVEQWLKGFVDAKFILTDSFHACVFSIIFNKPFLVYGNIDRGMARFESLLFKLGLEERLVTSERLFDMEKLNDINWEIVNQKLEEEKEFSINFLKNALV